MSKNPQDMRPRVPDLRCLALGALGGLLAAGYGILRQDSSVSALPSSAVARVNDINIGRDNYKRVIERLPALNEGRITPENQAKVIGNLINDELLLQQGLESGMARSDGAVLAAIASSGLSAGRWPECLFM